MGVVMNELFLVIWVILTILSWGLFAALAYAGFMVLAPGGSQKSTGLFGLILLDVLRQLRFILGAFGVLQVVFTVLAVSLLMEHRDGMITLDWHAMLILALFFFVVGGLAVISSAKMAIDRGNKDYQAELRRRDAAEKAKASNVG